MYEHLHHVLVYIYKMVNIDGETYENNKIDTIADSIGTLWLNEKHVVEKLGHKNLLIIYKYK